MKLRENVGEAAFLAYTFDTGDGQKAKGTMPAPVALEIARRKGKREIKKGEDGDLLVVDGLYEFPADAFELEEGDLDAPKRRAPSRRRVQKE